MLVCLRNILIITFTKKDADKNLKDILFTQIAKPINITVNNTRNAYDAIM